MPGCCVSIEAGEQLVRRIGPSQAHPGGVVLAGVGRFSALFDLKSRGYRNPFCCLHDGVGTKLKMAFQTGIHDTIGIDLVAWRQRYFDPGRQAPLFFSTTLFAASLSKNCRRRGREHRRRLPAGRSAH